MPALKGFVVGLRRAMSSNVCLRRIIVIVLALSAFLLLMLDWKHPSEVGKSQRRNSRHDALWDRDERVVVFEEHHEALPYWFTAITRELIPAKNNVLLHIDGHSDNAPPEFPVGYPKFRLPRSKRELRWMMQENDIFLQAAAMTGMFKRIIWVWPHWDLPDHPDGAWVSEVLQYGEATLIGPEGKTDVFCSCRRVTEENRLECYSLHENMTDFEEKEVFPLDKDECRIKGSYEWVEVGEHLAIKKLLSGTLIKQDESLLVDIDEDFFGCQSAGQLLVDAGVSWELVETMDELIDQLVCPRRTVHEIPGEALVMPVVHRAIELCKHANTPCGGYESDLNNFAVNHLKTVMSKSPSFLCTKSEAVYTRRMHAFAKQLRKFERSQLLALAKTGICMMTTPKSDFFINTKRWSGTFQICHGFNQPNETVVRWHWPDETDVRSRLQRLESMFVKGRYPEPKLVTVCRSIRDGYTPRNHFEFIENGILDIFRSKLSHPYKVHFDLDLLGGPSGWPKLHETYHLPK